MAKLFAGNKLRLFVWIQAAILAVVIVSFGAVAIAQSGQFGSSVGTKQQSEEPGMLLTASPTPSAKQSGSPSLAPGESADQGTGGGAPQMDAKYKKLQDEMTQCGAALDAINNRLRALLAVSNSLYDQLTFFEPTPLDPNATFEENQAVWAADEARRQAIQAQLDAASAAVSAYEATTPMASGHGMGCWQGSGPYPR